MPKVRDYFPGNNTPNGFFSYYRYILSQEDADKIICVKGGPGTGKSTFMRKIGQGMIDSNKNVDFLHCSADENSIDGIVVDGKLAFIDGTSPHMTDPITPGAVDSIVDLGLYWNESKITENKYRIIRYSKEASRWYEIAYNYLGAARKIYDSLNYINTLGMEPSDIDRVASLIVSKEIKYKEISFKYGKEKKAFATAITSTGIRIFLKSLLKNIKKIYFINCPEGFDNYTFFHTIRIETLRRGIDLESYYCPMNPADKIEHIIIPELDLAFVTCNKWHDIEPWEIFEDEDDVRDTIMIDFDDFISQYYKEKYYGILQVLSKEYYKLINEGINCLSRAKENHDIVEQMYIRNMDFTKIDKLALEYIEKYK